MCLFMTCRPDLTRLGADLGFGRLSSNGKPKFESTTTLDERRSEGVGSPAWLTSLGGRRPGHDGLVRRVIWAS